MASPPPLGQLFSHRARRPLRVSSERFAGNFLGDGVRAVARVPMILALQEAVMEVSKAAGAAPGEVDRVLPTARLGEIAARVDERQKAALSAIRRNDLTMTDFGRPTATASPAAQMLEVAEHFSRDKPIADSLRALSTEVAAWEALLEETAALLDTHRELVQRYQRTQTLRRLARGGLVLFALFAVGVVVAGVLIVRGERAAKDREARELVERQTAARVHLDEALGAADPCATPSERDLAFATSGHRAKLEARRIACEAKKKAAAEQAICHAASDALGRGEAPATLPSALDPELAKRLADKALGPADLKLSSLPCGELLWRPLVAAASASPTLWGQVDGVSKEVATRLRALWAETPPAPAVQQTLSFRAEAAAITATLAGTDEALDAAAELCALKLDRSAPVAISCRAVLVKRGRSPDHP